MSKRKYCSWKQRYKGNPKWITREYVEEATKKYLKAGGKIGAFEKAEEIKSYDNMDHASDFLMSNGY
jgi:hypothetical protein